jgi:hypothetical protein
MNPRAYDDGYIRENGFAPAEHPKVTTMEQHASQPANVEDLQDFLNRAERDADARAGDPFDRTQLPCRCTTS